MFTFKTTPPMFSLQEFYYPQDADDARRELDGEEFGWSRIFVEFATGVSSCYRCFLYYK